MVHPVIDESRKDNQKRVRIAVLDTGVDATHPEIRAALNEKKIVAFKGFPDSLDPLCDQHGHGTHGTSVLLKTAPTARIYVGRMADDSGNLNDENGYSDAAKVKSPASALLNTAGDRVGD